MMSFCPVTIFLSTCHEPGTDGVWEPRSISLVRETDLVPCWRWYTYVTKSSECQQREEWGTVGENNKGT